MRQTQEVHQEVDRRPDGAFPNLSRSGRIRRKLQTKRARQRYALLMETMEPLFGQIKQGRGFRQFLLGGLEEVNGEWPLTCTGHALLKLFLYSMPTAVALLDVHQP